MFLDIYVKNVSRSLDDYKWMKETYQNDVFENEHNLISLILTGSGDHV